MAYPTVDGRSPAAAVPTSVCSEQALSALAQHYGSALLDGRRDNALQMILDAVAAGVSVPDLYLRVFQRSQYEIGRLWQEGRISVAEEHYCTSATQWIMAQLYPYVFASKKKNATVVVICVASELHELGARMVADLLEMDGWNSVYLGANVPSESVLTAVRKYKADVLAISATLSQHVEPVRRLIQAVREDPAFAKVRILVGGGAFNATPDLAHRIGANADALDGAGAVEVANKLHRQEIIPLRAVAAACPPETANALAVGMLGRSMTPEKAYDELTRLNNELVNLQRELSRKNAELLTLNALKDRFLGLAAHDLRTPLAAIMTFSQFLEEEASANLNEEQRGFVTTIREASQAMLGLIEELLDVSVIESGQLKLSPSLVDLRALLQRNVAMNQALANRKSIHLELACPLEPLNLQADPAKIEQVLNNLIGNAVKFSDRGSTVRVSLGSEGRRAIIAVRDQGPGIPADELSKLFTPFGTTTVRGTAGERSTGLGLAIVRRLVEAHGGEVKVESKVGAGSTFSVWMPLQPLTPF